MRYLNYFLVLTCCLLQTVFLTEVQATSFTSSSKKAEFPDYNPFAKEGIFSLNDDDAYNLVFRCKIRPSEELEYWILSENLIRLVDKRLDSFLKKNKLTPKAKEGKASKKGTKAKKVHKQYFGMKTDSNHKFIYIFVYPPPSSAVGKEEGNTILLCGNISDSYHKIEFDYKTLKFKKF